MRNHEHERPEPRIGRSAAFGAVIGFVVATVVTIAIGVVGGLGGWNAAALGVCVGLWGGGGFGFLMGATIPIVREHDNA